MTNEEYFKKVREDFDLSEELAVAVATAKFFIERLGMNKESVLKDLNLTDATYNRIDVSKSC